MFAGFGTADETNERFHYLLEQGQTGLSTAFDMPTLMGYDSDAARSLGEVGREGVAIDTLADMEDLFAGIPLDEVTVSMTINAPAAMMLAMYACMARRRGIPLDGARRHDPDGHPQGVHRAEGVDVPARAVARPGRRHDRVVLRRDAALAPGLDQRVPHPRGGSDRRPGARVHARRRLRLRRGLHRARPAGRSLRARASRSSSTRTSTSSRRSPSTAPRAASGRASCATASARARSARC